MGQFLPRGYQINENNRITRMLSSGGNWQIYFTNRDTYVLAVKTALYEKWVAEYSLPTGIFSDAIGQDCKVYVSSSHYIVSSLERGPFPEGNGQIEAFSIAFKTALDLFPNVDVHDAIYIEEYSLVLPVSFQNGLLGCWLLWAQFGCFG